MSSKGSKGRKGVVAITKAELRARAERERLQREFALDIYEALPRQGREAIAYEIQEDLKREGWHDEDDCDRGCMHAENNDDVNEEDTASAVARRIQAEMVSWHDATHGLSLLALCKEEPCKSVAQELIRVLA